ncbi:MAG: L-threonylcarbamoyladenylate synthase [Gemmatimonadetes bacterium]|nr:L-threonylcarbamoyladenylate synthase [Gemmatimonadota bacterium]
MNTEPKAIPFWSEPEIASSISGTLLHLEKHGVLAYPTETVYGFGGAIDSASVSTLVALKRRPDSKPFLLLISDSSMIDRMGLQLSNAASMLAARFWPGPLTLVLAGGERRVPARLRGPEGGIAVRWTPHPGLQRLIASMGDPLTSTSANLPGTPPAMNAATVMQEWSQSISRGTLRVLDGGTLTASAPSTVVDCTGRSPRVIRPGAISAEALRAAVPSLVGDR